MYIKTSIALLAATFRAPPRTGMQGEIQKTVDAVVLYHMMALAANDTAPAQARAIARHRLSKLAASLTAERGSYLRAPSATGFTTTTTTAAHSPQATRALPASPSRLLTM